MGSTAAAGEGGRGGAKGAKGGAKKRAAPNEKGGAPHPKASKAKKKAAAGGGGPGAARAALERGLGHEARGGEGEAEACYLEALEACGDGGGVAKVAAKALLQRAGLARRRACDSDALDGYEALLNAAVEAASEEDEAMCAEAMKLLCLHLHQQGRHQEADFYLRALSFQYRLSAHVLRYRIPKAGAAGCKAVGASRRYLAAIDGGIPDEMVEYMAVAYGEGAAFWREHNYWDPCTGYFSYLHALSPAGPSNGLEQVLWYVQEAAARDFPAVGEAKFVEWWAHCRPHNSGHQLHFDSDNEGEGDEPVHPIVSCVLYLTEGVGGPTLVTDQVRGGRLASQGWLAHSKKGRLVVFDGSVLHGVIPGRGVCPEGGARRVCVKKTLNPKP